MPQRLRRRLPPEGGLPGRGRSLTELGAIYLVFLLSLGLVSTSFGQDEADSLKHRPEAVSLDSVHTFAEQDPELIGDLIALWHQVQYPESAREAGIKGRVYVRFVVDTSGAVRDPAVIKGVEPGCDEEALRVVGQARFTPGRHNGVPVNVQQTLLIRCEPNVLANLGPPRIIALETSPSFVAVNRPVRFGATLIGEKPISYQWNFGDGSTGATANPTHTYRAPATHVVTLEVSNRLGTARDTLVISVAEDIYVMAEQMPELIGGLQNLQRQIRYPEEARRAGIQGRVILRFIVNENGDVQDAKVVRGIGGGCDNEALRVVRQAKFKPGKHKGKAVKVKMSLPITFRVF